MPDEGAKTDREKVIERVLAFANVTAESGAAPGEVENARRLAARLISKYALTVGEVEAHARRIEAEYAERLRGPRRPGRDPYEHAPPNPPPPAGGPYAHTFTPSGYFTFGNGDGVFVRIIFG